MPKTATPTVEVMKHKFPAGHPRYGGKKKRTAQMARDLADSLNVDPLRFLLQILKSDTYTQTVIGPDGKKSKQEIVITMETRIDAAKAVAGFFYSKLNSNAVTGSDHDGPVQVSSLDVAQMAAIMADPAKVEAAQNLALILAAPADGERRYIAGDR
jgi:hypothetical protein